MPVTYYLGNVTDTTLGTGANFSVALRTTITTAATLSPAITGLATETDYAASPVGSPGTTGTNGVWTVEVNVTTAQTTVNLAVRVDRYNSSNVLQSTGTATATQTLSPTGVKTFSPVLNAGTWAAGDRFRVAYIFTSTNMTGVTPVIQTNTVSTEHIIPDPVVPQVYMTPVLIQPV